MTSAPEPAIPKRAKYNDHRSFPAADSCRGGRARGGRSVVVIGKDLRNFHHYHLPEAFQFDVHIATGEEEKARKKKRKTHVSLCPREAGQCAYTTSFLLMSSDCVLFYFTFFVLSCTIVVPLLHLSFALAETEWNRPPPLRGRDHHLSVLMNKGINKIWQDRSIRITREKKEIRTKLERTNGPFFFSF